MPKSIDYDAVINLVTIKYHGDLGLSDIKDGAEQGMRLGRQHKCNYFLIDNREASLALSTMDLYKIPDILANIAASLDIDISRGKRAILVNEKQADHLLVESVTKEQDQYLKIFDAYDAAINWLKESH